MNNKVELIGIYGSDKTHAQSAWTSTSRNLTESKISRIPNLLNMLAREGHHTPFEKSSLHFLVTSDIATHIQFLKHRIGVSINAESARYKELRDDKYHLPSDWSDKSKQKLESHILKSLELYHTELKNVTDELVDKFLSFKITEYFNPNINNIGRFKRNKEIFYGLLAEEVDVNNDKLKDILPLYNTEETLLEVEKEVRRLCRKRAKESARFYLPYANQITYDVMFNFRSFYHFLNLRNKPDAQFEIRELASEMLNLIKNIEGNPFKHTINAFNL